MTSFLRNLGLGIIISSVLVLVFIDDQQPIWPIILSSFVSIGAALIGLYYATNSAQARLLHPEALGQARIEGRVAFARVERALKRNTDDDTTPTLEVILTVQPANAPAYLTEISIHTDYDPYPRFNVGQVLEVVRYGKDQMRLAFTGYAPGLVESPGVPGAHQAAERGALRQRAVPHIPVLPPGTRKVPTWGLIRLNADGTSGLPVVNAQTRRRKQVKRFAGVVGFVLGLSIIFYPHLDDVKYWTSSAVSGHAQLDHRSAEQLRMGAAKLSDAAGHDRAVSLTVFSNQLLASMPVTPGEELMQEWRYAKMNAAKRDIPCTNTSSAEAEFSLNEIQWDKIWPLVEASAAQSGLPTDKAMLTITRSIDLADPIASVFSTERPVMIYYSLSDSQHSQAFQINAETMELSSLS